MTLLLAATHVVAFLLGALACRLVVLRYGPPLVHQLTGDRMPESDPAPDRERSRSTRFIVAVLIASVVVIVIGGQAYFSNRVSDHQRGCLNRWADSLTTSIQARTTVGTRLRNAQKRKDRADDRVTDVFVAAFIVKPPPPPKQLKKDFADALRGYVKARDHLAQVIGEVETTTAANPYPNLDLDCDNPLQAGAP